MKSVIHLWAVPSLLASLTLFGLLAALLGTGYWQPLAWMAVGIPVAVLLAVAWRVLVRRRR